jgi:hypothetical protein
MVFRIVHNPARKKTAGTERNTSKTTAVNPMTNLMTASRRKVKEYHRGESRADGTYADDSRDSYETVPLGDATLVGP